MNDRTNQDQPNGPALLREAAALLLTDRNALPGPTDVRREIYKAVQDHPEIPAGQRRTVTHRVWDLVAASWARDGWPIFATVEGWAHELRFVADDCDAVAAIGTAHVHRWVPQTDGMYGTWMRCECGTTEYRVFTEVPR